MDYSITIGLGFSLIMVSVALLRIMARRRADVARVPVRSGTPFRTFR